MARDKEGLAKFADVRAFFESWGLYPSEEEIASDLNPDNEQSISERCYTKLVKEATTHIHSSKYKDYFAGFCRRQIDATDGGFYLSAETWDELEEAWDTYIASLRS